MKLPVSAIDIGQVLMWFLSLVIASAGGVSYLQSNYESKESAREMRELTNKRLDRIEEKIDRLIERR